MQPLDTEKEGFQNPNRTNTNSNKIEEDDWCCNSCKAMKCHTICAIVIIVICILICILIVIIVGIVIYTVVSTVVSKDNPCCSSYGFDDGHWCCKGYKTGDTIDSSGEGDHCKLCVNCNSDTAKCWEYRYEWINIANTFIDNNDSNTVCGELLTHTPTADKCGSKCSDYAYYNTSHPHHYGQNAIAFYINTIRRCYCKIADDGIHGNYNNYYYNYYYNISLTEYCDYNNFEVDYNMTHYGIISNEKTFGDGRPYNIKQQNDIKSCMKLIDCDEYEYHFIDNDSDIDYNHYNDEYIKYAVQGISEHSSIATFNKFTLELMNIGLPLWFIEKSQNAALDEIKHTQITFDIANILKQTLNNTINECITFDVFPFHTINLNNDWETISIDVVIGGCFGETISSLNNAKQAISFNNNNIKNLLYMIANDEITHSALSWIVAKWMIQHNDNISISKYKWWINNIPYNENKLILSIFKTFWNYKIESNDNINQYINLYNIIINIIQINVQNIIHSDKQHCSQ